MQGRHGHFNLTNSEPAELQVVLQSMASMVTVIHVRDALEVHFTFDSTIRDRGAMDSPNFGTGGHKPNDLSRHAAERFERGVMKYSGELGSRAITLMSPDD